MKTLLTTILILSLYNLQAQNDLGYFIGSVMVEQKIIIENTGHITPTDTIYDLGKPFEISERAILTVERYMIVKVNLDPVTYEPNNIQIRAYNIINRDEAEMLLYDYFRKEDFRILPYWSKIKL